MNQQLTTPETGVTRFSTDAFPKNNRLAMWLDLRSQIVKLDVAPLTESIRFSAVGMALPGLGIVASDFGALRTARSLLNSLLNQVPI